MKETTGATGHELHPKYRVNDYRRSDMRTTQQIFVLLPALVVFACGRTQPEGPAPDFVLVNGHVVTMDATDTIAQAVAVTG